MSSQPELPKKIKEVILIGNHKILTKFPFRCIQRGIKTSLTEFVFPDPSNPFRPRQSRVAQNSWEHLGSGKTSKRRFYFWTFRIYNNIPSGPQALYSRQIAAVSQAPNWAPSGGLWSSEAASEPTGQQIRDTAHHQLDPLSLRGGPPGVPAQTRSVWRLHGLLLCQLCQASLHRRLREGYEASLPGRQATEVRNVVWSWLQSTANSLECKFCNFSLKLLLMSGGLWSALY